MTKVEEARDLLELDPSCAHERGHGCGLCWKARCATLESAIREEERVKGRTEMLESWRASCREVITRGSAGVGMDVALAEALRAEKVRVLEMLDDRISHPDNAWATLQNMLSEARAEGASEMDHGFCKHKPRCPSGPPSEEPEHSWTSCDDPFYRGPNPLYGSYERTAEHHREWHRRHPKKEPVPGGCPTCKSIFADRRVCGDKWHSAKEREE